MMFKTNLAQRFKLLSLLILAAVAIPTAAFMQRTLSDLASIRQELAGVQPTMALLKAITDVQQHRLQSGLQLSAQPAADQPRSAALQSALSQLQVVMNQRESLREPLAAVEKDLRVLAEQIKTDRTTPRESFEAHGKLLGRLDDAVAQVLAQSKLLHDPEPENYYLIVAGFQEGKTVVDQLAQLHDLGYTVLRQKGASPLDLNQIAAVKARLEDRERFVLQNIGLAQSQALGEFPAGISDGAKKAQQAVSESLNRVNTTFLGFSPDFDVKPEDYAQVLQTAIQAQRAFSDAVVQEVQQRLTQRAQTLTLFSVTLGVLLLGLLALLAWRLWAVVQAIVQPLGELARKGDSMAQGDLTPVFESQESHELGRLIQSLEGMRLKWIDVLSHVQGSAHSVNNASLEISAENLELSRRTEQSAARLQAASHLVQQLTAAVQSSADAAQQADGMARHAASVAGRGAGAMADLEQTMDEIHVQSGRISEITSVIDSIAFQTNILALNAAVEAARAGEQGRGFAVVAAEVRVLAQRSAAAAKEIKSLITSSGERVAQGNQQVRGAGQTMRDLSQSVQQLTEVIQSIVEAARSQQRDIERVEQDVSALDEMTQQNAAVAEQSAAASDTLAQMSTQLSEAVGRFRLPR
ncbi:MAG: methyl-accepting chemotaxis protein [Inhella sp.]|jgi:methyl-accepting chemotaxis protein|uniref:methyl-accepting chemotaxis protein n=1 Tax=Inhella sp. TaxID=1921806 RepID=UPI0022C1BDA8|nr:methyl-accepting chemotaxis protein [Inhella sp.]MCZ8234878.1 methyl-accepting chemotaxis protein [Inhella sp.]